MKAFLPLMLCIVSLCVLPAFTGRLKSSKDSDGKVLACYYTPDPAFLPATKVPANLCTHVIFAFAKMTPGGIQPSSASDPASYKALVQKKTSNPDLKILISLQKGFSSVVDQGSAAMESFAQKAVGFLQSYGLDGMDLDWEFPKPSEKAAYAQFIKILSLHLRPQNLLLTAALPHNSIAQLYDVQALAEFMDWMTVMTYHYHSYVQGKDNVTGYNSPLFSPIGESPTQSTRGSMAEALSIGLPANKLLMGVPTYGRSWTLADPKVNHLHAPAVGTGGVSPFSHLDGVYSAFDVSFCEEGGAAVIFDGINGAQYLINSSIWVAYDGVFSITQKMQWLLSTDFRGAGVWAMQLDNTFDPARFLTLIECMKGNLFK